MKHAHCLLQLLLLLLAITGSSATHAQPEGSVDWPSDVPDWGGVLQACNAPQAPAGPTKEPESVFEEPGQNDLTPGRFIDNYMLGHGWDLFWYTENLTPPANGINEQRLFVTWYTYRREADGGYQPIWYVAAGDIQRSAASPPLRLGFDAEIWEFSRLPANPAQWGGGAPGPITSGANSGGRKVGWLRIAFNERLQNDNSQVAEPDRVGAWWRFNDIAGANSGKSRTQCLTGMGRYLGSISSNSNPLGGYSGSWWIREYNASGAVWMSYFHSTFEQHVLLYFSPDGSGSSTGVPRWAHAVAYSDSGGNATHPCQGRNYSLPTYPDQTSALCLLSTNGYAPDGADRPSGGWDFLTQQTWRGSLERRYPNTTTGAVQILSPDYGRLRAPSEESQGIQFLEPWLNGNPLTLQKRISVHAIRALAVGTSPSATPVEIANRQCQVHSTGAAAGYCDLRLHWINNRYPTAAVFMRRFTNISDTAGTNERVLVRDSTPITPAAGYGLPPRGTGTEGLPVAGVGAGEAWAFELYRDRSRSELLAVSDPVMGIGATGCTAPIISAMTPTAGAAVSTRDPRFRFTLQHAGTYRLKFYRSGGAFVAAVGGRSTSAAVDVRIPDYLLAEFGDMGGTYSWVVEALTPCSVVSSASATFVFGEPAIPDAPAGATAPANSSSTAPLVGAIPMQTGVDGGAATIHIPIEVPPGRRGMQPDLSLDYSSRAGNGIAGMGWSVSGLSAISRCPQLVDPDGQSKAVDFSSTDRLCLDGQRLVVVTGTYGASNATYRTEIDTFARITQYNELDTAYFVVELKSGERRTYGAIAAHRSRPVLPNGVARTLSWTLSRREDRSGNTVNYEYRTAGRGEHLLNHIAYTGLNGTAGDRWVRMDYESRPTQGGANDQAVTYIGGARIDQTLRLVRIVVGIGALPTTSGGLGTGRVREYSLNYGSPSDYTGRSILRSLSACVTNAPGGPLSCLPNAEFDWQSGQLARAFRRAPGLQALVPQGSPGSHSGGPLVNDQPLSALRNIGDLDGDGTSDLLAEIGRWDPAQARIVRDRWLVQFDADRQLKTKVAVPPQWMDELPLFGGNAVDFDNDGRAELWARVYSSDVSGRPTTFSQRLVVRRFDPTGASSTDPNVAFPNALDALTEAPIVTSGRIAYTQSGSGQLVRQIYGTTSIHFGDVNSDLLPDLIVQRAPMSTDPADHAHAAGCPADNTGYRGEVVLVYLNTTVVGPGTVRPPIRFESVPSATQRVCVESSTNGLDFRNSYARLVAVEDWNADGIIDLQFHGPASADKGSEILFGTREGPLVKWSTAQGAPANRVKLKELGPDMASHDWEDPDKNPTATWLDINGDGLQDLHYAALCEPNSESGPSMEEPRRFDFVRFGTGGSGTGNLLSPRQVVGTAALHSNCQLFPTGGAGAFRRPNFQTVADFDDDGRQELLFPQDFAARLCTKRPAPNGNEGPEVPASWEDGVELPTLEALVTSGNAPSSEPSPVQGELAWYCPEHPTRDGTGSTTFGLLPATIDGEAVLGMYSKGLQAYDDSLYTMAARKFVLAPGAGDTVSIQLVEVPATTTGIVMRPRSEPVDSDLYGDGLSDWISATGCRYAPAADTSTWPQCVSLGDAKSVVPAAPQAGCTAGSTDPNCQWGPKYLPDGQSTPAMAAGLFLTESLGPISGGTSNQPTLQPDMLWRATALSGVTGAERTRPLAQSQWMYATLASGAGRPSDEVPLYSIPARDTPNSSANQKHFYFRSSMPVVDTFVQATGSDLSGRLVRFGYQEALYHNAGRGFRGFRKIIEENFNDGLRTTRRYGQFFPLSSALECEAVSPIDEPEDCTLPDESAHVPIRLSRTTWSAAARCGGSICSAGTVPYYTVLARQQRTQSWTLAPPRAAVSDATVTTTYDTAGRGNPVEVRAEVSDYLSSSNVATLAQTRTTLTSRTFDTTSATTDAWWLDRQTSETTTESVTYGSAHEPPTDSGIATTQSSVHARLYAHDATRRQVTCQAQFNRALPQTLPDCASATSTPGWESTSLVTQFDDWGNATVTRVIAHNAEERTSSIGFGETGYFPTLSTNALNQSSSSQYNAVYGVAESATDIRQLTTGVTLDALGREVVVTPPTSGSPARRLAPPTWTARQWCTSTSCASASNALYREVIESPGTPTAVRYFDREGRTLRTETTGFGAGETIVTTTMYDERGRITQETGPAIGTASGPLTRYRHDLLDRVTDKWVDKPNLRGEGDYATAGVLTRYVYVGLRTDITVSPCSSVTTDWQCTAAPGAGDTLQMSRTYDSADRVLSTTDALQGITRFWYDGGGRPIAIRDVLGNYTRATYDTLGRRLSSIDPNRGTWYYVYDGLGQLRQQTDARGLALHLDYDLLGRLRERRWREPGVAPETASTRCLVDTWTYDALTSLLTTESRQRVASLGDGGTCTMSADLTEQFTRAYTYLQPAPEGDPFYRPTLVETSITLGQSPTKQFRTATRYDGNYGRVKQRILPGGVGLYLAYNARGDLVEEGYSSDFAAHGSSANVPLRRVLAIDALGNATDVAYANGVLRQKARHDARTGAMLEVCAQTNDSDCRQALENRNVRNEAKYLDIGYDYDAYGNVVRQTHYAVAPRSTGQIHANPIVELFSYDLLHRLTSTSRSGDPSQSGQMQPTALAYDAIGNLKKKSDFSANQPEAYAYAEAGKPYALTSVTLPSNASVTYSHDANGNVASRVVPSGYAGDYRTAFLSYDIDNLPLRVAVGAEVPLSDNRGFQFRYGPDQKRYFESELASSDNARTRYYVDTSYEVDFHNGSLSEERYYLTDGVMLLRDTRASDSRSGLYLVARDRLGSSTATLLATRTGNTFTVVRAGDRSAQPGAFDHRSYDAFGRPRDSWGVPATPPQALSPRGFTQHEHLTATQLIHMNGRVFDPVVGRFYGVDPVIQFPANSQSLNPYSYILNNPLSGTDPTGYVIDTVWDVVNVLYDVGKIGVLPRYRGHFKEASS